MERPGTAHADNHPPARYPAVGAATQTAQRSAPSSVDSRTVDFIIQAAAVAQLSRLRQMEESKIPTGSIALSMTISGRTKITFAEPLLSIAIINNGSGSIRAAINHDSGPLEGEALSTAQTWEYDAGYPIITSLTLSPTSTTSASVGIRGKKGRRVDGITPT